MSILDSNLGKKALSLYTLRYEWLNNKRPPQPPQASISSIRGSQTLCLMAPSVAVSGDSEIWGAKCRLVEYFLSIPHTVSHRILYLYLFTHLVVNQAKNPHHILDNSVCTILIFSVEITFPGTVLRQAIHFCQPTSCRIRMFCFWRKKEEGEEEKRGEKGWIDGW